MPRAAKSTPYTNFSGGFVTEATDLSYPQNTVKDVDNCDILINGSIRRRFGLDAKRGFASSFLIDTGWVLSNSLPVGVPTGNYSFSWLGNGVVDKDRQYRRVLLPEGSAEGSTIRMGDDAITVHPWPNAGNVDGLNLIVIQTGNILTIRNWDDLSFTAPQLPDLILPVINLGATHGGMPIFMHNWVESKKEKMDSAVGNGNLWLTSKTILPFYLSYSQAKNMIEIHCVGNKDYGQGTPKFFPEQGMSTESNIAIRDFVGLPDGLKVDEDINENDATYKKTLHIYNLHNQGWRDNEINAYRNKQNFEPTNAQQWFAAKNSSGIFDADMLRSVAFGASQAPRGMNVFPALLGGKFDDGDLTFSKELYGSETAPDKDNYNEVSFTSFSTCTFFAGRLWLSGDVNTRRPNGVYFSSTIQSDKDAGVMCSTGDPTSESFPDVIDSDGGVIYVTDANHIRKLVQYGSGVLVFATNGVWFISGGASGTGFTATTFSIDKISDAGLISSSSVVRATDKVIYWSYDGIYAIALPQQGVIPVSESITSGTIYSYYTAIPDKAKENAQGAFDQISNKIIWSWLDTKEELLGKQMQNGYNRMLILDSRTGAFTKYSFDLDPFNGDVHLNGPVFPSRTPAFPFEDELVKANDGTTVQTILGDNVVIEHAVENISEFTNAANVLLVSYLTPSTIGIGVSQFNSNLFSDYASYTGNRGERKEYNSYVVTAPELLGDLQRNKAATYVRSYFKRTEDGFTNEGELKAKNASACMVQGQWDFSNGDNSGRWTKPQKAYRELIPYVPANASDEFNTGFGVIKTKVKMRGQGVALSLKFFSIPQCDFRLLGYNVEYTANAQ